MISVITPFHNAEKTLAACIESILVQTERNWELILIDDGSTDRSAQIAEVYRGQDPRILFKRQEQGGVSGARNAGLAMARGRYVSFVDADDRLAPSMLEVLRTMLETEDADMAGCGFAPFAESSDIAALDTGEGTLCRGAVYDPALVETLRGDQFIERGILRSDTRIWSKLIRRECIGGARFRRKYTIGEDMLFLLELTPSLGKVVRTSAKLYYYYSNPAGAMEQPFTPRYMDQVKCWDAAAEWIAAHRPELMENADFAARLASIRAVSVMLVAGKLARLPGESRREYAALTEELLGRLEEALRVPGMKKQLPGGYPAKILLFRRSPALYYRMYGRLKRQG